MPLHDFACPECGRRWEDLLPLHAADPDCPECETRAKRLPGVGRDRREDPDWLRDVPAVADKEARAPHVRAFLADPCRASYRRWLRGEGLRPLEPGEGRDAARQRQESASNLAGEVLERFKARRGA